MCMWFTPTPKTYCFSTSLSMCPSFWQFISILEKGGDSCFYSKANSSSLNGCSLFTKMAAMPIYMYVQKHLKVFSFGAKKQDTWYTALGTRELQNLFK